MIDKRLPEAHTCNYWQEFRHYRHKIPLEFSWNMIPDFLQTQWKSFVRQWNTHFPHITEHPISLLTEMCLKYCSLMRLEFIQMQNKKLTYAVSLFSPLFIAGLWMDHKRKHMEVCIFISMVVVKYLRHFFDFIYKSASWTSVVLSLTWKL